MDLLCPALSKLTHLLNAPPHSPQQTETASFSVAQAKTSERVESSRR